MITVRVLMQEYGADGVYRPCGPDGSAYPHLGVYKKEDFDKFAKALGHVLSCKVKVELYKQGDMVDKEQGND